MEDKEFKSTLQALEISEGAAEAYLDALRNGPLQNPNQISISQSQELANNGLAVVIGNDKVYALEPGSAFEAVSNRLTWRQTRERDGVMDLPAAARTDLLTMLEACERAAAFAGQIYNGKAVADVSEVLLLESEAQFSAVLSDVIGRHAGKLRAVSKSPRLRHIASIWGAISRAIKSGRLTYERIVDLAEIVEHGLTIVERDISEYGIDLYVLPTDQILMKFYVLEPDSVLIFSPKIGASNVFDLQGQLLRSPFVARHYQEEFIALKQKATPARVVLQNLRRSAVVICESLNLEGTTADVFRDIVEYGIFLNPCAHSPAALEELLELRAIVSASTSSDDGPFYVNYGISDLTEMRGKGE